MPNRNTVDEREKYDHSGHSTQRRQEGDLKAPGSSSGRAPSRGKEPNRGKEKFPASQPVTRPR
jgi:hypothetical protein